MEGIIQTVFKIFLAFVLSFVTVSTSICYAIERYNSEVNVKFLKKLVKISDILFVLFLAIFSIAYGTDFILFVLLLSVVLSFVILLLYCAFVDKLYGYIREWLGVGLYTISGVNE